MNSHNFHSFPLSKISSFSCKKCDVDSHENFMPFLVTTRLGGGLVQIDTKFHDYSMSFIQVLFVFHATTWHGFWTSSSHGISMAFAKKMMGFPSDLVSFSTKLRSKTYAKFLVTFYTGCKYTINYKPKINYFGHHKWMD